MKKKMTQNATNKDKYSAAMSITSQAEADEYFNALVDNRMSSGVSRSEAMRIERSNLGYWAGYYDQGTRLRVEKLFRCKHPVFGAIAKDGQPSPEQAFRMGIFLAAKNAHKK